MIVMLYFLVDGVTQDGDTFYHDDFGPLVTFPGTVAGDYDIAGAERARALFAAMCPELVTHVEAETGLGRSNRRPRIGC